MQFICKIITLGMEISIYIYAKHCTKYIFISPNYSNFTDFFLPSEVGPNLKKAQISSDNL